MVKNPAPFLRGKFAKSGSKAPDTAVHFLHIGKNAGTQICQLAKQINRLGAGRQILRHPHDFHFKDLPPEAAYFFSIRQPISRFMSGFYSRKRKGQPKFYNEWTACEAVAFNDFDHANDLAEALFLDGPRGAKAWGAIKSIQHTAQNQSDWFCGTGNFLNIRPPLGIIRVENFRGDLNRLMQKATFGVEPNQLKIVSNAKAAHANDYTDIPELSALAKDNLTRWYAQDIAFYTMCERWVKAL